MVEEKATTLREAPETPEARTLPKALEYTRNFILRTAMFLLAGLSHFFSRRVDGELSAILYLLTVMFVLEIFVVTEKKLAHLLPFAFLMILGAIFIAGAGFGYYEIYTESAWRYYGISAMNPSLVDAETAKIYGEAKQNLFIGAAMVGFQVVLGGVLIAVGYFFARKIVRRNDEGEGEKEV